MVTLTALCSALVLCTSRTSAGTAEVPVRTDSHKVKDLGEGIEGTHILSPWKMPKPKF